MYLWYEDSHIIIRRSYALRFGGVYRADIIRHWPQICGESTKLDLTRLWKLIFELWWIEILIGYRVKGVGSSDPLCRNLDSVTSLQDIIIQKWILILGSCDPSPLIPVGWWRVMCIYKSTTCFSCVHNNTTCFLTFVRTKAQLAIFKICLFSEWAISKYWKQ